MPAKYDAIKRSLRREHPDWPDAKVKEHASRIFVGTSKNRHKAAKQLAHG